MVQRYLDKEGFKESLEEPSFGQGTSIKWKCWAKEASLPEGSFLDEGGVQGRSIKSTLVCWLRGSKMLDLPLGFEH